MDAIIGLRVNHLENPLGIQVGDAIRFSWQYPCVEDYQRQTAYEVLVANDASFKEVVWRSGEVAGGRVTGVRYAGPSLIKESRYFWKVRAQVGEDGWLESSPASFVTEADLSQTEWVLPTMAGAAPRLRLLGQAGDVSQAYLYIAALGCYSAWLNGQRISANGDFEILCPGWTDYKYYVNYQSYDVTHLLQDGGFVLGVELGKGWYAGRIGDTGGYDGLIEGRAGKPLAMLARLVLCGKDGTKTVYGTKAAEWQCSAASPVLQNDLYDGETRDMGLEALWKGWSMPGTSSAQGWCAPENGKYAGALRPGNKAIVRLAEEHARPPVAAWCYSKDDQLLRGGEFPPMGALQRQAADLSQAYQLKKGTRLIVDFGQNAAGVVHLHIRGPKGTTTTIEYAEMLNDGRSNPANERGGSDGPKGSLYRKAILNAEATDRVVLSGGERDSFLPVYTYHGFRYAEIYADQTVEILSVCAETYTSVPRQAGTVETNHAGVNRLFQNAKWSQISNYLSIPTDCPQRGERVGWTGDAQLFAQTALLLFNCAAFLENYVDILQEHARQNGDVYGAVVPSAFRPQFMNVLSSGWGDAGIILPWVLYKNTGDTWVLEKHFNQMDRYMQAVEKQGYSPERFGDWLSFEGASTPYMNAVYRAYTLQLMRQAADAIGRVEDARRYADAYAKHKQAFLKKYVTAEGSVLSASADGVTESYHGYPIVDDAQTALLWALKCGLYPNSSVRDNMLANLLKNIKNVDGAARPGMPENSLAVGFLGVNVLLPVLGDNHAAETAYSLLLQDQLPSWLYSVANGATTIWERWNSYSDTDSFGDANMNSFNHYAYGSCVEWMYQYMAGIRLEWRDGAPVVATCPQPDPQQRIDRVRAVCQTVLGPVSACSE